MQIYVLEAHKPGNCDLKSLWQILKVAAVPCHLFLKEHCKRYHVLLTQDSLCHVLSPNLLPFLCFRAGQNMVLLSGL